MGAIKFEPIPNKTFGAVVSGVKLNDLSDEAFAKIKEGFLQYGFLAFPGQFLTDAENVEFGGRFGELEFACST